jgi:hypothetical protein
MAGEFTNVSKSKSPLRNRCLARAIQGIQGMLALAGCDASGGITKQYPQYLGYSCRCHDLAMGGLPVVRRRLLRPGAGRSTSCVDSELDVSKLPVAVLVTAVS